MSSKLEKQIDTYLKKPVPAEIKALSEAARKIHGDCVLAVLAYGSCLRGTSLSESLADLYVLVSDYKSVHKNPIARIANRLLPPNVYYLEITYGAKSLRAKYALVSLDQFARKCADQTENPYFWARFAQPSALVWAKDQKARKQVTTTLAMSIETLLGKTASLGDFDKTPQALWQRALLETYRTEWRSESKMRAADIISADLKYYRQAAQTIYGPKLKNLKPPNPQERTSARTSWALRRFIGKSLSILRLAKASFTFQGGAEYIAWKITRHSGVEIKLSAWQRRHPVIAGLLLLPKLYRKGAIR